MNAPAIPGHTVQPITDANERELQALFEEDPDYFDLAYARIARPNEAGEQRSELPPGKTHDDKFFFVIADQNGRLVGLIDIVRGYPVPSCWFLGHIFLAKGARGAGLGRSALRAIYAWVKQSGGTALRLGVVEGNDRARRLYATEGFIQEAIREIDPTVKRMRRTLVLRRDL